MKNLKLTSMLLILLITQVAVAQSIVSVSDFDKAIISPHIETTFVQGEENSVTIIDNKLSNDKVNIEVKGNTLRVYLDDAKELTKHKRVIKNGSKMKVPIYQGKVLEVLVTYKHISHLSLRGEQKTVCESPINIEDFKLKIYGDSTVILNEVNLQNFDIDIFGEGELFVNKGNTGHQRITTFGEGIVNLEEVKNKTSKLKAYGEAEFRIQSSEHIRFSAYGEAQLFYTGSAEVDKGLSFGNSSVHKI